MASVGCHQWCSLEQHSYEANCTGDTEANRSACSECVRRMHGALRGQCVTCHVLWMDGRGSNTITTTITTITMCLLSAYLLCAHGREEEPRLVEATSYFLLVCFSGFVFLLTEGHRVSMSNDGGILC